MKVLRRYNIAFATAVILIVAAFLRLYRIADYMTFLGDEGRDALVVKGILSGHLVFLGPRASAGDFFLGPIYYYMMAPFLWLFHYDPVGPAVMVALLGIATVYLVYYVGREFFGTKAGLIAAALYAASPLVIQYSRSSWNPNPVPFFTLLMMYCLYKAVKLDDWKLYILVGFLFGILMQLHYIVVFLGVIIPLSILLGRRIIEKKVPLTGYLQRVVTGGAAILGGFLLGFSPFLAFEIKNHFPNFRTIFGFVTGNVTGNLEGANVVHGSFLSIVSDVYVRVFGRLLLAFPTPEKLASFDQSLIFLWKIGAILLSLGCFVALWRVKDKLATWLVVIWIVVGILLFGIYKKPIYDYYFTFLFPVPFLLIGNLLSHIYESKKFAYFGKIVVLSIVLVVTSLYVLYSPLRDKPNKQMQQMRSLAEFVISKTDNKPFNFALITQGNSDHAYRYFFEVEGHKPVQIENEIVDPKRTTVTDQLLIICESVPCSPLGHPQFEVAAFGRGEIAGEWGLNVGYGNVIPAPPGTKPFISVYKLMHYTGE